MEFEFQHKNTSKPKHSPDKYALTNTDDDILTDFLMRFSKYEQALKWIALFLGILGTIAIVLGWHPFTMFISIPFCIIWVYCAWLHNEKQLKYVNIIFLLLYSYGVTRYLMAIE